MRLLKSIFNFYLDASIHVALAVNSLYLFTLLELNKSPNFYFVGFLFFSTIVCYNFMKYGVEAEKYFIVQKSYHKIIQVFSFFCFPLAVYCFFNLNQSLWFPIALLTIISGFYIMPFLPNSKNLRALGGLKIYLVAAVWLGFTVVLPLLEYQIEISSSEWVLMARRLVLVIILFIPFEIRDLKVDKPELKTLPQRLGVPMTKRIGYALVVIYTVLLLVGSNSSYILAPIIFLMLWLSIAITKKNQSKYYASFFVEGIPILLLGMACFFGGYF